MANHITCEASGTATPGLDYGAVVAPIIANPGDSQACFNIEIKDDMLVEENKECLMISFTAETLMNLTDGTMISSVCCIVDDDSKYMIITMLSLLLC